MNLSKLHMSELISDTLKIPLVSCIELDSQTGRYDKRVTIISNAATKVIFKGVPISVPNEELLHLCEHYGDLVDEKVTRQTIKLGNEIKHDIMNST